MVCEGGYSSECLFTKLKEFIGIKCAINLDFQITYKIPF